jgi:hypothetical protein
LRRSWGIDEWDVADAVSIEAIEGELLGTESEDEASLAYAIGAIYEDWA